MTILDFFKTVDPSVLAAKMIFRHLLQTNSGQKISEIADTSSGGTPNRGIIEYYNGDIPWVKSGELKDGLIKSCDEYITEAGLKNSSAKLFPRGTLLVAMYGANIGKTGILDFDATTNQAICAIFPKVDISKEFLFWYFKQQRIDFIAIGKGGAQPNISQTVINNTSIVVPDKKSQKKIVEFLDKIKKGNGIDNNFFIPEVLKDVEQIYKYKKNYVTLSASFKIQLTQIENLNQAILQEAVQGKLLAQNKNDEPAGELLKRIKEEKAKSGKKEKPLPPIKAEEIPFEIPKSWVWCRLGDISELKSGNQYNYPLKDKGVMFVKVGDMNLGGNEYEIKSSSNYFERTSVKENDLIKVGSIIFPKRGGAIATNKRRAILSEPILVDSNTMAVIPSKEMSFDYFLHWFGEIDLSKLGNDGVIPQVNNKDLNPICISLPPLSEQKRIVAEIEKQLAKTKQLKEHIIANQQATEQLLKALLHGAFGMEET